MSQPIQKNTNKKVLVAYASKYGATAEVAQRIADQLTERGFSVTLSTIPEVRSLDDYQALVIGSAIYIGQWRKEVVTFLKKNVNTLSKKEVWLFSTGPTGKGDPVELLKGWKYPDSLKKTIDRINPVDIAVFHGSLDTSKLSAMEKMAIKMVKAPEGDFRDWDSIDEWTNHHIAKELGK